MINRLLQIICAALVVSIATAQTKEPDASYAPCFDDYAIAYYPGGDDSLRSFLRNNLVYPQKCVEDSIDGCVLLHLLISRTGKIDTVKVLRTVHPLIDQEAVRVVRLIDYWIPAVSNGAHTDSWFTLPVKFKIQH